MEVLFVVFPEIVFFLLNFLMFTFTDTGDVHIFACMNFRGFTKMDIFAWIKFAFYE